MSLATSVTDERLPVVVPDASPRPMPDVAVPRVLVVEDDDDVRSAISQMLQRFGFEVVGQGANGQEGVELAERLRPQVVLMDLRMPVMDGIEATRRIRAGNSAIPVVILSAYDDRSLEMEAGNAGAFCYLLKGMRAGVIRDVLHKAVAGDSNRLNHLGSFFFRRVIQTEATRTDRGTTRLRSPSRSPSSPRPDPELRGGDRPGS